MKQLSKKNLLSWTYSLNLQDLKLDDGPGKNESRTQKLTIVKKLQHFTNDENMETTSFLTLRKRVVSVGAVSNGYGSKTINTYIV